MISTEKLTADKVFSSVYTLARERACERLDKENTKDNPPIVVDEFEVLEEAVKVLGIRRHMIDLELVSVAVRAAVEDEKGIINGRMQG